ncbi:MAG: PD40 domain-containing protein [Proteobacteria bacterium]|nr:PD40 domain-containing protein [Pseudomonadota bacterium]
MRTLAISALAALVVALSAPSAHAATFDPGAGWRSLDSAHFKLHYPERLKDVAEKSAVILEEYYPTAVETWGWKPLGKTHVIINDNTDESNGLAAVLPYAWMLIYVAPPNPDSSLAHYDDWLRMLLIHEFTHIVQIDAVGGFWRPFRCVFGKTAAPSGMNPVWFREGVAQFTETYFTQGGRGRGYYSEMVVRMSVLDDAFPSIDEADGLGWRWPGYKGAYIYGIKFTEWLVDVYGVDRYKELDRRIRSSPLLGMLNHHTRNVYGKTFYELWNEWKQALSDGYAAQRAEIEAGGLTAPDETVFAAKRDEEFRIPTLSPDGSRLAYQVVSPHGKPEIMVLDLETGESRRIQRGHTASQFSWSPDGQRLVYSDVGRYKNFNRYSDLWMYDFGEERPKKRLTRLTRGERARDPDFDRSGASVVFVAGDAGTDRLKRIEIASKEIAELTPSVLPYTQFANPRVSPDGGSLAVSVWQPGVGWRVWRYTAGGIPVQRITKSDGLVVESRPVWSRDGSMIYFSSDEGGIANLHRASPDGRKVERITNVLSGVFQPSVGPGGTVYAQYYTSKGFVIGRFDGLRASYPVQKGRPRMISDFWDREGKVDRGGVRVSTTVTTRGRGQGETTAMVMPDAKAGLEGPYPVEEMALTDRNYVAWGAPLLLPRFIIPAVAYQDDTIFASAFTGGSDPLRWHNWLAGLTYRTDANYFGFFGRYWYNRHKVIFGLNYRDYAVDFGNITFDYDNDPNTRDDQRTVHFYEKRRSPSAFVAVPWNRHLFVLSYFYEDHIPITSLTKAEEDALNEGIFAGFNFQYKYGDSEEYPASISRENGRTIQLTANMTDKHLGSAENNEQIIFSGDWREYVSLWRHHVLAIRAAGGMTWGDQTVQGTFGLGGAVGEGPLASGGSYTYFQLRGLPISSLSRNRAMVFTTEYRFPIVEPMRGLGTAPVFLKHLSGAIFVDYGNAWNAHEAGSDSIKTFFDQFLMGVGLELRGDFVLGHGLPIHGRLGYGIIVVNRDRVRNLKDPLLGTDIKYGTLLLTLGYAF